jgi:hypothetical protein
MTLFDLFLAAVAIQRMLLFWFTAEIFRPLREWLFAREGWVSRFSKCPMCVGFWIGVAAFGALVYGGPIGRAVLIVFALSGLSQAVDLVMLRLGGPAKSPPKES